MKNLKVSTKLLTITAMSVLIIIGVGGYGYKTTADMSHASSSMYGDNLLAVSALSQIRINNQAIESSLLELMLTQDTAKNDELSSDIGDRIKKNADSTAQLENMLKNDEQRKLLEDYKSQLPKYMESSTKVSDLAMENRNTEAYAIFARETSSLREQLNSVLSSLTTVLQKDAEANNMHTMATSSVAQRINLTVIILATILFLAAGFYISRLITRPLRSMQELMAQAESGNLTVQGSYDSKDEIGQLTLSFNAMARGLRDLVMKISDQAMTLSASSEELTASSEQTVRASEQIAAATNQMAGGFDTQVRTVHMASQSVEAMGSKFSDIEQNGSEMTRLVGTASAATEQGVHAVSSILRQMGEIESSVSETQERILSLGERTEHIGTFVTTINEIARQTNLLALNASIEASRAGEAGRGFAVVAEEIRKLADATSQSSKQIADIITGVQQESQQAVESMHRGAERVEQGVKQSGEVSHAFRSIEEAIRHVSGKVLAVEAAIRSAAAESANITGAMEQVSSVSEQGAASIQQTTAASEEQLSTMEEVASSARSLAGLAEELQHTLSRFHV
ncbi:MULTISPECIES: methyl-accepting chemotaxis protein [Paenibacillus]|uniref:methyl-accepting chemotaxis protein n=1 Tax=Paenibacillus TaxID=44249 RepID=UPI0022B920B7|nr:methyl-accepting chemotaxis protein [Paenibacillus caseinilyticus]MCZ8518917.1 methyl-accepting chemotaxis protein [Paenibacillus caseinilyticus]